MESASKITVVSSFVSIKIVFASKATLVALAGLIWALVDAILGVLGLHMAIQVVSSRKGLIAICVGAPVILDMALEVFL